MIATVALIVAALALAVGLGGLLLAYVVMRQNGDTTTTLREHRRAHTIAFGHADPKLDRRQVQVGPPRSTGERRGRRYEPDRERLAPRPPAPSEPDPFSPTDQRDPRDDAATGELERTDLPTTALPAQRPDLPDVRDIRGRQ